MGAAVSDRVGVRKRIISFALLCLATMPLVSALDHRFGWPHVPLGVVVLGNALIVLSYVGFCIVFRANRFGATTIQIAEGQSVASTGP